MAQEDAGRPLSGTDGWLSSAPASRSNQSQPSPGRERRPTNNTYKSGDGTEFPRYFLQIGQDIKRTRGYEMIQELQLMVCSRESGIKGNAARARVMVLLREVQGVLIGLENKVDAQTYDLGVFNVERSELRKELRDQKAKEFQPLHTIDFRSTEVKDLPYKLRTLFEDNQVLREQVRQLQYSVRSAESRLEASERRAAALEAENQQLCIALREAGSSADLAREMRQLREMAHSAEARALQLEMQLMSLSEQLDAERRLALQKARHAAAKHAMLESRLTAALSTSISPPPPPSGRLIGGSGAVSASGGVGGMGRKSSGRSAVYDPAGVDDGASVTGGGTGSMCGGVGGGGSAIDGGAVAGGYGGGGNDGRSSAHSRTHTGTSAGGAGRLGSGRERSASPPRSPSGRSISHSPGSVIPALYPLFNAKQRSQPVYSTESTPWLCGTTPGSAGGSGSPIGGGGGGAPPPSLARNSSLTDHRPAGQGGPTGRPSSGSGLHVAAAAAAAAAAAGREGSREARPLSSRSATTSSPGEEVRALNSSAVVTSRALLPSVSGAAGGGGSGGGRVSAAGGGAGILGLRVNGGVGSLRRSAGSDDMPVAPGLGRGGRGGEAGGARDARQSNEPELAGRWALEDAS